MSKSKTEKIGTWMGVQLLAIKHETQTLEAWEQWKRDFQKEFGLSLDNLRDDSIIAVITEEFPELAYQNPYDLKQVARKILDLFEED